MGTAKADLVERMLAKHGLLLRQAVNTTLYGFPLGHERVGKTLDGLQEVGNRNRLSDIGVATAFQELFFVALPRESRDRDNRDRLQCFVVLQPLGHFKAGIFVWMQRIPKKGPWCSTAR